MAKTTKGKGPGRPKGTREKSNEQDGSESDTAEMLRQRILDETRQDVGDAVEAGGSGNVRQDGAEAEVEGSRIVELDEDGGPTETGDEAARKKKEEAARKKSEAANKKKALEKKAEEVRKAKKAADAEKEKVEKERRV